MNSYWDLYVAYIDKCVRDNWANDIDPAHYDMEWNHFLPKSVFGDWPIGQWLTLRQHAIASALQTVALRKRCMFGWHKQYLPKELLEVCWPIYCEASSVTGLKQSEQLASRNRREKYAKGVPKSKEHKQKISEALTGKIRSEEHCKNISKSKKGVPNLKLRGRTFSEEHRANLSKARRNRKPK